MEVYQKLDDMYEMFSHFTVNEWIYETKAIVELEEQMTPEDREIFFVDPKRFTWKQVVEGYFYGFMKYMQKEDVVYPDNQIQMLLNKNHLEYFENSRRAFKDTRIVTKDPVRIKKDAFLHAQNFIDDYFQKNLEKAAPGQQVTRSSINTLAWKYLNEIEANISPLFIRASMYFFLNAWEKLFTNI